jgi:hypothetical protein
MFCPDPNRIQPIVFDKSQYPKQLVSICLPVIAILFFVSEGGSAFGLEFSNHTSEKYRIQFQYPSNWQVIEKTNRFDESSDIRITNPTPLALITISYVPEPIMPGAFRTSVDELVKTLTTYDYTKEQKVIEDPTFLTIDGQEAATFLFTSKDKYDDNAITIGDQAWLVNNIDHSYVISFLAPPTSFDSPENTQIRDRFIKSINFLGVTNQ